MKILDETNLNSLQVREHCYNDLGKRCVIKTDSQDVFKKYTGVFAISSVGGEGWELYEKGGMDSIRMKEFLRRHITGKYKEKVIEMDNASSHRNEKVKQEVNEKDKLLYRIPYQPYTNAIENFFSVLKSKLQKMKGLKYEELKKNIEKAIKKIPSEKYKRIIEGVYRREGIKYEKKESTKKKELKKYII